MRHPVLGQDVPPCPRQQHGSTKQLYLCATQLNNTASAAHNSMEVEVEPSLKKKKGGVMATCRFPAMQGLVRAAPRYRYVHCACAVAVVPPVYEIYVWSSHISLCSLTWWQRWSSQNPESQVTSSPPHPVQYKSSLSRRIPDIPGGLGCQLGPSNCSPLEPVAV